MTVLEIVKQYFEANGFDGLSNLEDECGGCEPGNFVWCNDMEALSHCVPGYRVGGRSPDICLYDDDCKCEWHMRPGPRPEGDTNTPPEGGGVKKHESIQNNVR